MMLANDLGLGLPAIQPFSPRASSEYYGAAGLAAAYCGVASPYPVPFGNWMHGYVPTYLANDPEVVKEYLALHQLRGGRETLWSSTKESAHLAREAGWPAEALGLPITYLPETVSCRRPNTLLVM